MNLRDRVRGYPELLLLTLCWIPYYIITQPIPSPTQHDNLWMSEKILRLVTGKSLFAIRDPYLRYIPQATVLELIAPIQDVTLQLSLLVTAHYTILVEGLLTPLAVYAFARTVHSRQVALGALAGVALFQFHFLPWSPPIPGVWGALRIISGDLFCGTCLIEIFGRTWATTSQWHYAFALPWIILAFLFTSSPGHEKYRFAPILAGICLGIAGSLQIVQGLYAAIVIAVTLIWSRDWRSLGITALVSMIIASPNIPIILRFHGNWSNQATNRLEPAELLHSLQSPLILAVLPLLTLTVAFILIRGPRFVQGIDLHLATPPESTKPAPILFTWPTVTFGFILTAIVLEAGWFRFLAGSILKYAWSVWVGIVLIAAWQYRTNARGEMTANESLD